MNVRGFLAGLGGKVVDDVDQPTERTGNMRATVKYEVSGTVLETDRNVEIVDPDDQDEALLMLKRRVRDRKWHGTPSIRILPTTGPARGQYTRTYPKDD